MTVWVFASDELLHVEQKAHLAEVPTFPNKWKGLPPGENMSVNPNINSRDGRFAFKEPFKRLARCYIY